MTNEYETISKHEDEGSIDGYVVDTSKENISIWLESVGGSDRLAAQIRGTYESICILKGIYVEENYRGRGVGSELLEEAINSAESLGAGAIILEADKLELNNFSLIHWYKEYGFEIVEEKSDKCPLMIRQIFDDSFSEIQLSEKLKVS